MFSEAFTITLQQLHELQSCTAALLLKFMSFWKLIFWLPYFPSRSFPLKPRWPCRYSAVYFINTLYSSFLLTPATYVVQQETAFKDKKGFFLILSRSLRSKQLKSNRFFFFAKRGMLSWKEYSISPATEPCHNLLAKPWHMLLAGKAKHPSHLFLKQPDPHCPMQIACSRSERPTNSHLTYMKSQVEKEESEQNESQATSKDMIIQYYPFSVVCSMKLSSKSQKWCLRF